MHLVFSALALFMLYVLVNVIGGLIDFFQHAWPFILFLVVCATITFRMTHTKKADVGTTGLGETHTAQPQGRLLVPSVLLAPRANHSSPPKQRNVGSFPSDPAQRIEISAMRASHRASFPFTEQPREDRRSPAQVSCNSATPTRGLVIMGEPLDKIITGRKTMELRSKNNRQLGSVALIRKGSGQILAVAEIYQSVGPMTFEQFSACAHEHQVDLDQMRAVFDKGWVYGWRLRNVVRLRNPVHYIHKGMSQVRLNQEAINELARQLSTL